MNYSELVDKILKDFEISCSEASGIINQENNLCKLKVEEPDIIYHAGEDKGLLTVRVLSDFPLDLGYAMFIIFSFQVGNGSTSDNPEVDLTTSFRVVDSRRPSKVLYDVDTFGYVEYTLTSRDYSSGNRSPINFVRVLLSYVLRINMIVELFSPIIGRRGCLYGASLILPSVIRPLSVSFKIKGTETNVILFNLRNMGLEVENIKLMYEFSSLFVYHSSLGKEAFKIYSWGSESMVDSFNLDLEKEGFNRSEARKSLYNFIEQKLI